MTTTPTPDIPEDYLIREAWAVVHATGKRPSTSDTTTTINHPALGEHRISWANVARYYLNHKVSGTNSRNFKNAMNAHNLPMGHEINLADILDSAWETLFHTGFRQKTISGYIDFGHLADTQTQWCIIQSYFTRKYKKNNSFLYKNLSDFLDSYGVPSRWDAGTPLPTWGYGPGQRKPYLSPAFDEGKPCATCKIYAPIIKP